MYFPGDPLLAASTRSSTAMPDAQRARAAGRRASTSTLTEPDWALGYRFDIVLRGRDATPMEEPHA